MNRLFLLIKVNYCNSKKRVNFTKHQQPKLAGMYFFIN